MAQAAQGCDVIVNGLNPPVYRNWNTEIPRITRDVIAAARASGATVILPGNVYVFAPGPEVWRETTTHSPETRKGRIRAELGAVFRAAAALAACDGLERFDDIPFPGPVFSAQTLREELEVATGRKLRLSAFPWWSLRLASPVWTLGREMLEMRYLFETDHALDRKKFDRLLPGFRFSPDQVAMRAELRPEMAGVTAATVVLAS